MFLLFTADVLWSGGTVEEPLAAASAGQSQVLNVVSDSMSGYMQVRLLAGKPNERSVSRYDACGFRASVAVSR